MGPWLVNPDPNGLVTIRSPGRWPDTASGDRYVTIAADTPAFTHSGAARRVVMTLDRKAAGQRPALPLRTL